MTRNDLQTRAMKSAGAADEATKLIAAKLEKISECEARLEQGEEMQEYDRNSHEQHANRVVAACRAHLRRMNAEVKALRREIERAEEDFAALMAYDAAL